MKETRLEIYPAKNERFSIQTNGALYINGVSHNPEVGVSIEEKKPQSKTLYRYEIILPLFFNDSKEIPGTLLDLTLEELVEEFGGVSLEQGRIIGFWRDNDGLRYKEQNTRIFCDVPLDTDSRTFFRAYKKELETRFKQKNIWMVAYLIDVV